MGTQYKMNAITGELDLVENLEEINAALERGILKSVDVSGENMIFTFNTPDLAPVTVPLSHFATNLQGHAYIGLATPSTTPVTLKGNEKVFYIATEEGDYSKFGLGNISELSVIKSESGSWKAENFRLKFLSLNGGRMQGNIDMSGKRIDNIGIEEVDKLPTFNLYEGRMVKFKNKTCTFYNGLWLALSDDLRGRVNDTHEENFVYQPTASDLSVKDGFATIKKLKGNTAAWNQICVISAANCSITINSENSYIATPTKTGGTLGSNAWLCGWVHFNKKVIAEHKYLIKAKVTRLEKRQDVNDFTPGMLNVMVGSNYKYLKCNIGESVDVNIIIKASAAGDAHITCNDCILQIDKPQLFDLTQMFGEGNEPATVEEFEAMFPNEYYEYNVGELMSFDGKGVKSVGFNQWDEEWEVGTINNADGQHLQSEEIRSRNFIPVISGATYYCNYTGNGVVFAWFYDSGHNYIGKNTNVQINNAEFVIPANVKYMRIATWKGGSITYNHNICINLVHSGYRNGEYEKYEDYTLSFQDGNTISQLTGKLNGEGDSVVIFPDGLRSAGTVYDEIVYDEATGKHKAIKRIGSVDLGALNWSNNNMDLGSSVFIISSNQVDNINMARNKMTTSPSNMLSVDYYPSPTYSFKGLNNAISGPFPNSLYNGALMVKNTSYTDVDSFKASLQGQILYYELAEPEVYDLDFPINTSYEAYDFGTEEVLYSDDKEVNIPMKANIEYGFNAVDMIRNNFEEIRSLKERVTALEQAILQIQTANIAIE